MRPFIFFVAGASAGLQGFLTRDGSALLSDGAQYRFAGVNTYWLGLDENTGSVAYPTHFRVTDALTTIAGVVPGATIRAHTLGISTGNARSFEPSLGVFNSSALDSADWAIAEAERLGLRIIVPLTDNWRYYHGGKHDFTTWCGDSDETHFYTLGCAIAAFKDYIAARLSHVNPYTQRTAVDEPAIAMWETGNEIANAPAAWTEDIAAYIKSLDKNHLVMDGNNLETGSQSYLGQVPSVDVFTQHFYPPNAAKLEQQAAAVAAVDRAYIVGEYGWVSGGGTLTYNASTLACLNTVNCSGTCVWSLFPHADSFGFVQHNDGFTFHYPGDDGGMSRFIGDLRANGAAMAGVPVAPLPTPLTPAVTATLKGALSWRGAALAETYHVQLANAPSGPWVDAGGAPTDDDAPFKVPGGLAVGKWVRLRGVGDAGLTGPWSDAWQVAA